MTEGDLSDLNLPLELSHVTIGVLTALSEEYAICRSIFDPDLTGTERDFIANNGRLTCWICRVNARFGGQHLIAIARSPDTGNNSAAIAAGLLLQSCPAMRHIIFCGIAGAVPHPQKPQEHVRLGDIVVTNRNGVIQYDFGKQRDPRGLPVLSGEDAPADPFVGFEWRSPPRAPCPHLLAAVDRMHADEELLGPRDRREWEKKLDDCLRSSRNPAKWKRPPSSKDNLIDAPEGKGPTTPHPKDRLRRSGVPRVFHGRIGAASVVLADPAKRDYLRDKFGIKAVAMEDSGLADASWVATVGYLVVRGTCDYCNSTKNDDWHHYAALVAAAYARTVVEYLHPQPLTITESVGPTVLSSMLESSRQSSSTPACRPVNQSLLTSPVQPGHSPPKQRDAPQQHVRSQPASTQSLQGSIDAQLTARGAELSEWKGQSLIPDFIQSDKVQSLLDEIERLLKAGRFKECSAPSGELERLLKLLPRRGGQVREGWIMLGRLEVQRLQIAKHNNKEVDTTRLRSLYEEAENVLD